MPVLGPARGMRLSASAHVAAAVTAATISTEGHAPTASASRCETTNAANPRPASLAAVRAPWRRIQIRMQQRPPIASTTPPSGREPVAATTA